MFLGGYAQAAADRIDYAINYSQWLAGDVIVDTEVTGTNASVEHTLVGQDQVTVWVSAGLQGAKAIVSVRITTAVGRVFESTFSVKIT